MDCSLPGTSVHGNSPDENTGVGLRPYHPERARSCLISEAKQGRAWLVLGWEKIWDKDGYLLYSITTQVK